MSKLFKMNMNRNAKVRIDAKTSSPIPVDDIMILFFEKNGKYYSVQHKMHLLAIRRNGNTCKTVFSRDLLSMGFQCVDLFFYVSRVFFKKS